MYESFSSLESYAFWHSMHFKKVTDFFFDAWLFVLSYQSEVFVALVTFLAVLASLVYYCRRWRHRDIIPEQVKELVGASSNPRFRKRDKVLFYGRKMLRKVKNISGQVHQSKKRKLFLKFARKILQLKKDTSLTQLQVLEPAAEYLEEDIASSSYDKTLPSDALYLLRSLRVFGNFEKPVFLTLCKHTEILNIPAGAYLFKIGDPDEYLYVVQSGSLNVFITDESGNVIPLKHVGEGDSVTSLLSFTDVLGGQDSVFKTVSARASENSTVVRLPMKAFLEVFHDHPDIMIRVMQVIIVRLQRVTFSTLQEYLGLTVELMRPPNTHVHHDLHQKRRRGSGSPPDSPDPSKHKMPFPRPHLLSVTPSSVSEYASSRRDESITYENEGSHIPHIARIFQHGSLIEEPNMTRKQKPLTFEELDKLTKVAISGISKELDIDDETILQDRVDVVEVPAGTFLMRQDSHKDVALGFLLSGSIVMSQKQAGSDHDVGILTLHSGDVVGEMAVLTGEASFFTIKAKHTCKIAFISRSHFYEIMKQRPRVVVRLANIVVKRLSPFVRQVDFALDWLFLESGRALYRQDTESSCTYIVLSGRVRSVLTRADGKKELVAECGRGELVGIVEMVTQTPRSTTVMAVRDSELAKLPEGLFNVIKHRHPAVVTRLINLLGQRLLGGTKNTRTYGIDPTSDALQTRMNFSTIALVPVTEDVPLTSFGYELYHSLSAIGPTLRLTSDLIKKTLGSTIMDPNNEYMLTSWLAQQEDQHKISIYQCDTSFTLWTQRCIRQADCILIVAIAEKGPAIGKMEKDIERIAMRTQKELVLLHRENSARPEGTVGWLNARSWVSSHHHIQCPKRMAARRSTARINDLYKKVLSVEANIHSDFSRLARWLTGTSVGLVLGGGGARGAAHVGMIKAIQEAGIPIDMVGGVSIGSFIGGLWCMEKDTTVITQKARDWSRKMTHWWRQLLDLTYPVTSIFTGRYFNGTIYATFGEVQIEDLWIPYFNVTTDISNSSMRVHRHGSLWRYIRASMSLSGYMPPMCDAVDGHLLLDGGYVNNLPGALWRYVRASMSVSGIFPPMCDPADGHLLVDGVYINNVPADVMHTLGARHILAVDVGSNDDQDLTNYGDSLSGFWLLYKKWNPFTQPVKVPDLSDIQSRLSYVSCVKQLEEVKHSDYCEYIRPPVDTYKTLSFGLFDEIKEVGYNHGKLYFAGLLQTGAFPLFKTEGSGPKNQQITNYTFTDLAQMVCKPPGFIQESSSSESEEDEEGQGGYMSEPTAPSYKNEYNTKEGVRRGMSLSENELEGADAT